MVINEHSIAFSSGADKYLQPPAHKEDLKIVANEETGEYKNLFTILLVITREWIGRVNKKCLMARKSQKARENKRKLCHNFYSRLQDRCYS